MSGLAEELERRNVRESKLSEDNRQLNEKVSTLEKECAGLELELKAAENRYQQEVKAHEETQKSRLLSNQQANMEVVKGKILGFKIISFFDFESRKKSLR